MPFIVVRLARWHAGRDRQNRLRAIQGLHLALFVTAIILDIDVSADGIPTDGQHLNHLGDGPASTLGNDCKGTVTSDG